MHRQLDNQPTSFYTSYITVSNSDLLLSHGLSFRPSGFISVGSWQLHGLELFPDFIYRIFRSAQSVLSVYLKRARASSALRVDDNGTTGIPIYLRRSVRTTYRLM